MSEPEWDEFVRSRTQSLIEAVRRGKAEAATDEERIAGALAKMNFNTYYPAVAAPIPAHYDAALAEKISETGRAIMAELSARLGLDPNADTDSCCHE